MQAPERIADVVGERPRVNARALEGEALHERLELPDGQVLGVHEGQMRPDDLATRDRVLHRSPRSSEDLRHQVETATCHCVPPVSALGSTDWAIISERPYRPDGRTRESVALPRPGN